MGISSVAARPSRRVMVKARRCLTALVAGAAAVAGSLVSLPSAGAAPANNNFASATLLTGTSGSFSGTTVGGNLEAGEWVSSVWDSGHSSVWYKFLAPSDGELKIVGSCPTSGFTTIDISENLQSPSDFGPVAFGICLGGEFPNDFGGNIIVRAGSVYHVSFRSGVDGGDDDRGPIAGTYSFTAFGAAAAFAPVTPTRILDTRNSSPVGAGSTKVLKVTGVAGVPSHATAVALNITTTRTSADGYLTAWPAGKSRPTSSVMNWRVGATTAAMSLVTVGTNGNINLYNRAGLADVIVDVTGYFSGSAANGYVGLDTPVRSLDTRSGNGLSGASAAGQTRDLQITGRAGVPSDARAVVINLTSVGSTSGGFITAWPTGVSRPVASVLNRTSGQTIANLAVVPIGSGGKISLYNNAGTSHLVGDVQGYFTPASTVRYQAITPRRITDTRVDYGGCCPVGPGVDDYLGLGRPEMDAPAGSAASSITITGVRPTANSYLTVFNTDIPPNTSNVNVAKGETRANAVVGSTLYGSLKVYNGSPGPTHVVADLNGFFWDPNDSPYPLASAQLPQPDHSAQREAVEAEIIRNAALDREQGRRVVPIRPTTGG
uniref:Uncharacterized protein n=1 Tax=uncultured bacterium A1Q1_fos_15 TaxID=1256548 RepID=L7VZA6_9BACT|nr:hypothetical protein [uncultured bacterium A1Q1_fos_15]